MRFAPLILTGVTLALAATGAASGATRAGGSVATPTPARVSPRAVLAPPEYVVRHSLPDSVLARIDGREDITRRRFVRAVRLLGGSPDSLTPADRDRFLELVIEQRLIAARAVRDRQPWDHADSLEFLGERDNILVRAALSDQLTRIEQRRRALGQPDLGAEALGIAARESLMLELRPAYDEELLKQVGSRFAELPTPTPDVSPRAQLELATRLPAIPAGDTLKVLARSRLGEWRVADLLGDWRRLSSVYRPHIADNEGVRALVQNSLFEQLIRQAADDPALARRPEVAGVIADRGEYHAVSQYLQHKLIAGIPGDSLTLLAWYRTHHADFDAPARAALVLLTLARESEADSMARRFAVPGEAESLAFRAQRSGIRYTLAVTATGDSALYARAVRAGAGGVAGPERVDTGWQVFKVLSLQPSGPRPFADVRAQVERAWYEFESERRIRSELDSLKRAARIQRNERALRALVLPRPDARR